MRSNKLILRVGLMLIVSVLIILINGCSLDAKKPASNVIANVNGEEITSEDVKKEMETRKIGLELSKRIEGDVNTVVIDEDVFNRQIEQAKTEEQKRYYERRKRQYINQNSFRENDAFNRIIRELVLSQEAKKQGYEVTIEEARESRNQLDDSTRKMLEEEGSIEELKKLEELEEEAARMSGFKNREEWFEASLIGTAKNMARAKLKEKFIEYLMKEYPDIVGQQWVALRTNAWEDYTEYLLRKSKIKIYQNDFKVEYYEGNWNRGNLDLKNKKNKY